MTARVSSFHLLLPLAICVSLEVASGQTPTAPEPTSRLEQVESTYFANLRKLHAPVLQDYHRELELLRQQLGARARYEEMKDVDRELESVKKLMSTTGVMPYTALLPPPDLAPASPARPAPVTLSAADCTTAMGNPDAAEKGLPLGILEWKVAALPAGIYDVLFLYTTVELTEATPVTLSFAGQNLVASLTPERATRTPETFRAFRLGRVTLEKDASQESLILQSPPNASVKIRVRSVVLNKPRPPRPPE